MSVRVRFAPSPTGQIHIGNIRAAIFNWLFARHEGGKFLLRIEDTDAERSTPEAVAAIFDAMNWLGLDSDEEPVYQSKRMTAYAQAAEQLLSANLAYKEDKGGTGRGECILFRMPQQDAGFHDEIKGDLHKKAEDLRDFVIVRSDGSPVFHLANVVDDIAMKTTHIIRGDDHVENTFRHIALFRALGADAPRYAHLPMIVNAQGKPYSKRDGAAFVGEFRDAGYLPDALFNFLALLGWSPGDDREIMSRSEMAKAFELERVKPSAAQMDMKKLEWMNGRYLSQLAPNDFAGYAARALKDIEWARNLDEALLGRVRTLMQSRTCLFADARNWKYFFSDQADYDEHAVRKGLKKEGMKTALAEVGTRLAGIEFAAQPIEQAIHETEQAHGIKQGKLNFPVRVAVTGIATGAGLYETMELLGRDKSLARLDYAVANLCG